MRKKETLWLTLVELIIVIIILSILATIAFISFTNYTKKVRDWKRLADIKIIYEWLNLYKVKTEKTLLPENYIEVTDGSWVLTYQWHAWEEILKNIKISNWYDPETSKHYVYTTDFKRKKIQLLWYLENKDYLLSEMWVIKKAQAENEILEKKYPYIYWDKIWIILDKNNIPIQDSYSWKSIDINSNEDVLDWIVTYFWDNVYEWWQSSQTWEVLINQIKSVIDNTIPCNPTSYSWYTISSMLDWEQKTFSKIVNITNWSQEYFLTLKCENWELDFLNAIETSSNSRQVNCSWLPNWWVWNSVSTITQNWNWSTWLPTSTWSYNTTPTNSECRFTCDSWYIRSNWNCIEIPNSLSLSHIPNYRNFTISWNASWLISNTCKLQYSKDSWSTWTDLTWLNYDCWNTLSSTSINLPWDGFWSWSTISIKLINTSGDELWTFWNNLTCSSKTASSSSTPTIDEDCNGVWNNYTYTQTWKWVNTWQRASDDWCDLWSIIWSIGWWCSIIWQTWKSNWSSVWNRDACNWSWHWASYHAQCQAVSTTYYYN